MADQENAGEHEHVFGEEQEPAGRLVLSPCFTCGLSALDALEGVTRERDEARASLAALSWEHTGTVDNSRKWRRLVGPYEEVPRG